MFINQTLKEWIARLNAAIMRKFPQETAHERILTRLAKLTEEVGELAGEILSTQGHQRQTKLDKHSKETLELEFSDVIISTLSLAQAMDIDMERALQTKMHIVEKRFSDLNDSK